MQENKKQAMIKRRNRAIQLLRPILLREKAEVIQHYRATRFFMSQRLLRDPTFYGLILMIFFLPFQLFQKDVRIYFNRYACFLEVMMRVMMRSSRSINGDLELKCDWIGIFTILLIQILLLIFVGFKISQGIRYVHFDIAHFFKKPPTTTSNADILNAIEKQCGVEIDIPKELCCAISHEVLTQPCYIEIKKQDTWFRCAKAEYYERAILEAHLANQDVLGSVLCDPVTKIILSDNRYRIVNDHECAEKAEEFLDDQLDRHLNLSRPQQFP